MSRFWWQLRLYWIRYLVVTALISGLLMTLLITVVTVMFTGLKTFDNATFVALWQVASFWFYIAWSLAFLVSLVLSFRKLFNREFSGFTAVMLDCETKEVKEQIYWQDVLPLWRKFLFVMIWLFVFLVLILINTFALTLQDIAGFKIFTVIIIVGALLLQPLLLSSRNVRIRRK